MFENFEPDVGEPQVTGRTLDQTNAELDFELSNPAADRGGGHLQSSCRFREAVRFRHLGENDQRVEIGHDYPVSEKLIPNFAI
ncbi:MAG TPA: hypothetical protein VMH03_14240 [Terriglobales bacterium]|nr:hypothetical protein [Terriglobales bacterium]